VRYLQPKLTDNLFLKTGIELDDLVRNSELLKIEDDADYQVSMKEYGETIEKLQKE